ncbi:biotin transporter BioY [Pseudactinotalea sp. Z1732]|uniref:biotin transporter BioY n=1 Tax=Micrococcales TaxID=85006 RepID=UPI003C7BE126
MSTADPTPVRGVPSPGTAVDEGEPSPATAGAGGTDPERSGATESARTRSGAWRRAEEALAQGWQRSTPKARWVTEKAAPLSRWAAQVNLVQVAAGVAVTALAALLIAVAAQVEWEVGVLSAPLWLFVGAALLAGAVLGPWRGLLAAVLYLVMGLVGAAWAGDGTAAHTDGPWAGVLLTLPLAVLITGWISARHATLRSPVTSGWYFFGWFFFAALAGLVLIYAGGLWTLFDRTDVGGWAVFATMSARFPFDVAQCILVAVIAVGVHRFVPGLLRR